MLSGRRGLPHEDLLGVLDWWLFSRFFCGVDTLYDHQRDTLMSKAKTMKSDGRRVGHRIISRVTGLPPWLDGPNVRYWAKEWGISYEQATAKLWEQRHDHHSF